MAARIYERYRNGMQASRAMSGEWVLEFESKTPRRPDSAHRMVGRRGYAEPGPARLPDAGGRHGLCDTRGRRGPYRPGLVQGAQDPELAPTFHQGLALVSSAVSPGGAGSGAMIRPLLLVAPLLLAPRPMPIPTPLSKPLPGGSATPRLREHIVPLIDAARRDGARRRRRSYGLSRRRPRAHMSAPKVRPPIADIAAPFRAPRRAQLDPQPGRGRRGVHRRVSRAPRRWLKRAGASK